MAKLKIAIDSDIRYLIFNAEATAFGYSAAVTFQVKKTGTDAVSTLPAPDLYDLPFDQHEEIRADLTDGEED